LTDELLTVDGGGVRGYASLCSLEEVEKAIKKELDTIGRGDLYSEDFKPCDYFDIMCGTSTGGYVLRVLALE
jgi:patatin-like phospholipase/acyl hydrolase